MFSDSWSQITATEDLSPSDPPALRLPSKVVKSIAEYLTQSDCFNFCLVNKGWFPAASEVLWSAPLLKTPDSFHAFVRAINDSKICALRVRVLDLCAPGEEKTSAFAPVLESMWGVHLSMRRTVLAKPQWIFRIVSQCEYLQSLKIYGWNLADEHIGGLLQYGWLKEFRVIGNASLTQRALNTLMNSVTDLRVLHLDGIFKLSDKLAGVMANKCPHLTSLKLCTQTMTSTGFDILANGFTQLKELTLQQCPNLTDANVARFVENSTKLQSLFLSGDRLTIESFKIIMYSLERLQHLDLRCSPRYQDAPHTKHLLTPVAHRLRTLLLECLPIDDDLIDIITATCKLLETFGLSGSSYATEKGIQSITKHCRYLRVVELLHCKKINENCLEYLAQGNRSITHLTIASCGQFSHMAVHWFASQLSTSLKRLSFTDMPSICDSYIYHEFAKERHHSRTSRECTIEGDDLVRLAHAPRRNQPSRQSRPGNLTASDIQALAVELKVTVDDVNRAFQKVLSNTPSDTLSDENNRQKRTSNGDAFGKFSQNKDSVNRQNRWEFSINNQETKNETPYRPSADYQTEYPSDSRRDSYRTRGSLSSVGSQNEQTYRMHDEHGNKYNYSSREIPSTSKHNGSTSSTTGELSAPSSRRDSISSIIKKTQTGWSTINVKLFNLYETAAIEENDKKCEYADEYSGEYAKDKNTRKTAIPLSFSSPAMPNESTSDFSDSSGTYSPRSTVNKLRYQDEYDDISRKQPSYEDATHKQSPYHPLNHTLNQPPLPHNRPQHYSSSTYSSQPPTPRQSAPHASVFRSSQPTQRQQPAHSYSSRYNNSTESYHRGAESSASLRKNSDTDSDDESNSDDEKRSEREQSRRKYADVLWYKLGQRTGLNTHIETKQNDTHSSTRIESRVLSPQKTNSQQHSSWESIGIYKIRSHQKPSDEHGNSLYKRTPGMGSRVEILEDDGWNNGEWGDDDFADVSSIAAWDIREEEKNMEEDERRGREGERDNERDRKKNREDVDIEIKKRASESRLSLDIERQREVSEESDGDYDSHRREYNKIDKGKAVLRDEPESTSYRTYNRAKDNLLRTPSPDFQLPILSTPLVSSSYASTSSATINQKPTRPSSSARSSPTPLANATTDTANRRPSTSTSEFEWPVHNPAPTTSNSSPIQTQRQNTKASYNDEWPTPREASSTSQNQSSKQDIDLGAWGHVPVDLASAWGTSKKWTADAKPSQSPPKEQFWISPDISKLEAVPMPEPKVPLYFKRKKGGGFSFECDDTEGWGAPPQKVVSWQDESQGYCQELIEEQKQTEFWENRDGVGWVKLTDTPQIESPALEKNSDADSSDKTSDDEKPTKRKKSDIKITRTPTRQDDESSHTMTQDDILENTRKQREFSSSTKTTIINSSRSQSRVARDAIPILRSEDTVSSDSTIADVRKDTLGGRIVRLGKPQWKTEAEFRRTKIFDSISNIHENSTQKTESLSGTNEDLKKDSVEEKSEDVNETTESNSDLPIMTDIPSPYIASGFTDKDLGKPCEQHEMVDNEQNELEDESSVLNGSHVTKDQQKLDDNEKDNETFSTSTLDSEAQSLPSHGSLVIASPTTDASSVIQTTVSMSTEAPTKSSIENKEMYDANPINGVSNNESGVSESGNTDSQEKKEDRGKDNEKQASEKILSVTTEKYGTQTLRLTPEQDLEETIKGFCLEYDMQGNEQLLIDHIKRKVLSKKKKNKRDKLTNDTNVAQPSLEKLLA